MDAFREAQILVLIFVFLLASAAKLARPKDRKAVLYAVVELVLCGLLLVSAHPLVHLAIAMVLVAATWMLGELRARRPDEGCGCFGAISTSPIGHLTVLRTGLLAGAAIAALGLPHNGLHVLGESFGWRGLIFAAEVALLVAISPETAALAKRTQVPCERRHVPLRDTFAVLHASPVWREHGGSALPDPSEVWRELCWRFLVYPSPDGDLVFAVSLTDRQVRAALVAPTPAPETTDTGPNPAYVLV